MTAETHSPTAETALFRRNRARLWLVGVLAVALLALFVAVVVQWSSARSDVQRLQDREEARTAALDAARTFAVSLTSYDYRRIAEDVQRVLGLAGDGRECRKESDGTPVEDTPCFRSDYERVAGAQFQKLVRDNKGVAKGDVKAAGVEFLDLRKAQAGVLVAVDQEVTNTNRPQPRIDRNRLQLTLERQDGRWLVVEVRVL